MPKTASIGRMGKAMSEKRVFPDNATIGDVLSNFNLTLIKGESVAMNGHAVTVDSVIEKSAEIFIVPNTVGA
jgi:riboflavin synthase alpha subunit